MNELLKGEGGDSTSTLFRFVVINMGSGCSDSLKLKKKNVGKNYLTYKKESELILRINTFTFLQHSIYNSDIEQTKHRQEIEISTFIRKIFQNLL